MPHRQPASRGSPLPRRPLPPVRTYPHGSHHWRDNNQRALREEEEHRQDGLQLEQRRDEVMLQGVYGAMEVQCDQLRWYVGGIKNTGNIDNDELRALIPSWYANVFFDNDQTPTTLTNTGTGHYFMEQFKSIMVRSCLNPNTE